MIFSFVLTGASAVKYIINHAEITALFCSQDKLQNVSLPFLFQLDLQQSHWQAIGADYKYCSITQVSMLGRLLGYRE